MNGGMPPSTELPRAADLHVRRLGDARTPSPLQKRGVRFVDESCRVLLASDTGELSRHPDGPTAGFEPAGPRPALFFEPAHTRCGIVTCGGLCPGINDVVRSIVLTLWHHYGVRDILGFRYGYAGLVEKHGFTPMPLTPETVHAIHEAGGTVLGTSRGLQDVGDMVDTLQRRGIDALFTIGGDGTLRGASAIAREIERRGAAMAVVGVPKTIDNDLLWIERSFGFATAVNEATRAIVAAHTEAHCVRCGIGLVKLMGRMSGFIAAHATLANSSVNFCLVPEVPFRIERLLAALDERLRESDHAVIVVAEGAGQELLRQGQPELDDSGNPILGDIGLFLRTAIRQHFERHGRPARIKYIDPSYLIRSLPADSFDSALCLALGQHAAHAAMAGRTDMLVGIWNGRFTHVPLELATAHRRQLDPQGPVWQRVLSATGQPADLT